MNQQELLNTIALTRINGLSQRNALLLYRKYGSASAVFENLSELPPHFQLLLKGGLSDGLARAEEELAFDEHHAILAVTLNAPEYPSRLRDCDDAPLMLFYRGTNCLNATKVVSIVGTRRCTEYGKEICANFTQELGRLCPDTLVVSGLAYGVDIHSHRGALAAGLSTVGVLAHGLDRLYPTVHRATAKEMVTQGGLITEYLTQTNADKGNFVRRNRIIAGMSDACIVVESASHGGGLITADLARDYNRDVFAFPGRLTDKYSEGCNAFIRDNKASLITCAADLCQAMNWLTEEEKIRRRNKPIQTELFPELSPKESQLVGLLQDSEGKHINQLVVEANLPVQEITSLLFEMEMKGIVKLLVGGRYKLLVT